MKPMAAHKAKNKLIHGWSMHEAYVSEKRSYETACLDPSQHMCALRVPHGLMLLVRTRCASWGRTRNVKDALLLVSDELHPLQGEPEIQNRELLELATHEGTHCLFVWCSFTTDVMCDGLVHECQHYPVRLHQFDKSFRTNRRQCPRPQAQRR
jgi:hypothetical protein